MKNYTPHYAAAVSSYWIAVAALSTFASFYLLDAGFSNTAIGTMLAVAGIGASLVQPILAARADQEGSPAIGRMTAGVTAVYLLLSICIPVLRGVSVIVCFVIYAMAMVVLQALQPLVNSMGVETLNQRKPLNYGIARAVGSLMYAVSVYILGKLADGFGAPVVPAAAALFGLILFLLSFFYPLKRVAHGNQTEQNSTNGGALAFLRLYPKYTLVLAGFIMIYASHTIINTYSLQIITFKGGGSAEMGTAGSMAACAELVPMLLFSLLSKKFRSDSMLKFCGIFYTLKSLCTLLAGSVPVYYVIQLLQMFGWGLSSVTLVYYINRIIPAKDVVKGQAYATTSYTLGLALGSLVGGALLDAAGVNMTVAAGTVLAAAGTVLVFIGTEKTPVEA